MTHGARGDAGFCYAPRPFAYPVPHIARTFTVMGPQIKAKCGALRDLVSIYLVQLGPGVTFPITPIHFDNRRFEMFDIERQ